MGQIKGQNTDRATRQKRKFGAVMRLLLAAPLLAPIAISGLYLSLVPHSSYTHWPGHVARAALDWADFKGGKKARAAAAISFENAARFVARKPARAGVLSLAVEVTQEGHWRFANRAGEIVTAGTREELARVVSLLLAAPREADDAAAQGKPLSPAPELEQEPVVALFLTPDSIFKHSDWLKDLPPHRAVHVVVGGASYPLTIRLGDMANLGDGRLANRQDNSVPGAPNPSDNSGHGNDAVPPGEMASQSRVQVFARLRPGLLVHMNSPTRFEQLIWQFARPLSQDRFRLLALQPGARRFVPTKSIRKNTSPAMEPDLVDPHAFLTSIATVRRQTIVLQGRINGNYLHFIPADGSEGAVRLSRLRAVAAAQDVNLIILHTQNAAQPGSRNWLWQRIGIRGLKEAMRRTNYGDFFDALSPSDAIVDLRPSDKTNGRVVLTLHPFGAVPGAAGFSDTLSDMVGSITGNLAHRGVAASLRSRARQNELDLRLAPGIPAALQFIYFGALTLGVLGLGVARRWWRRIWPVEIRAEYSTRIGLYAARTVRTVVFVLIFLPLSGPFALIVQIVRQFWRLLLRPGQWWRRLRASGRAGI